MLVDHGAVAAQASSVGQRAVRYDLGWDVSISAAAAIGWLTLDQLAPKLVTACSWCDRNADGSDALGAMDRGARDALRWQNTARADGLSDVLSFGLAPLTSLGLSAVVAQHDGRLPEFPVNALLIVESTLLASFANQLVKLVAARERPDVHARSPQQRAAHHTTDDDLSFFSGHTNLAFVLATSSGTIASLRHYRLAPLIWATGIPLAAFSGYLRIAADRHYALDVLTGALLGGAIGFAVPYVFHRAQRPAARAGSAAPMRVITIGGTF